MREISCVKEFGYEDGRSIKEMIRNDEIPNKEKVLSYLKSFEPSCAASIPLVDELTGHTIASCVEGYEDDEYYWNTRDIYHFEKYNLELEPDFIAHVMKQ